MIEGILGEARSIFEYCTLDVSANCSTLCQSD